MKITGVSLWEVPLTSHESYDMSDGKVCNNELTVVIRIDTDTGHRGWGEMCPIPHYQPAYARGAVPAVTEMLPVLIGARKRTAPWMTSAPL